MAWLRAARVEVKRDMEIARDEVRVMTVHGAKGLEAPIVILADTMTAPMGPRPPRLLELDGGAVVWAGRKDDDVPVVAASRALALAEAENEYRRLLYVAMTRAADRLIICGADGERKRPPGCWYDLMRDALAPLLVEETAGGEKVFRYRKSADGGPAELPPRRGRRQTATFRAAGVAAADDSRADRPPDPAVAVTGRRGGEPPPPPVQQAPPTGTRRWHGGASCTG